MQEGLQLLSQIWTLALSVIIWMWATFSPLLIAIGRLVYDFLETKFGEWTAPLWPM